MGDIGAGHPVADFDPCENEGQGFEVFPRQEVGKFVVNGSDFLLWLRFSRGDFLCV